MLENQVKKGTVTLLFGAKDAEHNEALVLQGFLSLNSKI
jgi:uncharacterized protein YeaO (DUF488 family)